MTAQTLTKITNNFWFAVVTSITIVTLSFVSFILAEPQISHSQETQDFRIRQTITGEATFLINPTDVDMAGSINGITGGNSTGTTQFVVQSNSTGGHYVDIRFFDNAGLYAMYGDNTGSEDIFDYNYGQPGSSEPTYNFTPETNASFSYTVTSSSTDDTDPSFIHNGVNACNTGANVTADVCWATPSTTDFTIVDRDNPAVEGATTTIKFRVNVPSGASPAVDAGTYTATATLSLYSQ
jgi:hypothetical protein